MSNFLKELSISIGLLFSDHSPVADANGWKDYVWTIKSVNDCLGHDTRDLCIAVKGQWDWKRPQHFSYSYMFDQQQNVITSRLWLQNDDPADDDHVCVVAIFTNDKDQEVAVYYQNWLSLHGRAIERDVPIHPEQPVANITKLAVGTKQCNGESPPDAKNFYRIRSLLNQR